MHKPKYSLDQQVAVDFGATQQIGKIQSAILVGGVWRYGIRVLPEDTGETFVNDAEIKFYLKDGLWHSDSPTRVGS